MRQLVNLGLANEFAYFGNSIVAFRGDLHSFSLGVDYHNAGIATNVHYKPLPMFNGYKELGFDIKNYPNAYDLYSNEITLPLHTLFTIDLNFQILKVLPCLPTLSCLKSTGPFDEHLIAIAIIKNNQRSTDIHRRGKTQRDNCQNGKRRYRHQRAL